MQDLIREIVPSFTEIFSTNSAPGIAKVAKPLLFSSSVNFSLQTAASSFIMKGTASH